MKKLILGVAALSLITTSGIALAGPEDAVPFRALYDAVANLQAQIDSITLTAGPKGDTGDKGDTGQDGNTLHYQDATGNDLGILLLRGSLWDPTNEVFFRIDGNGAIAGGDDATIFFSGINCTGTPFRQFGDLEGDIFQFAGPFNGGQRFFVTPLNPSTGSQSILSHLGRNVSCLNFSEVITPSTELEEIFFPFPTPILLPVEVVNQ